MADSPYFFIKEFSNEELTRILFAKIRELKESKEEVEVLNTKLQDGMAKLEELQNDLIMQRNRLMEEVRQKNVELLRAERLSAIGQLSARIAHDLRNPLSVISNTSKILRIKMERHLDENTEKQWSRLDRAVNRLSHQLEDVLDYVRVPQLKREYYSLSLILHDVLERLQMPANIEFHPPLKDKTVYCDPAKMEIVFVNLLVNATQAIGEKRGTIRVEITDDQDDKFALISITDSGHGISKDMQERIFEPLYTTKQVGTGLGLSSCKNIIVQHGGTISIDSEEGNGASFVIRMPKDSDWDHIKKHGFGQAADSLKKASN